MEAFEDPFSQREWTTCFKLCPSGGLVNMSWPKRQVLAIPKHHPQIHGFYMFPLRQSTRSNWHSFHWDFDPFSSHPSRAATSHGLSKVPRAHSRTSESSRQGGLCSNSSKSSMRRKGVWSNNPWWCNSLRTNCWWHVKQPRTTADFQSTGGCCKHNPLGFGWVNTVNTVNTRMFYGHMHKIIGVLLLATALAFTRFPSSGVLSKGISLSSCPSSPS